MPKGKTMWRKENQSGKWKLKLHGSFWTVGLSHILFWEMDTTSFYKCFRKMEIAHKNGTAFREIPMKEEYGLSMLLASGFRLCSQAWKWSLRFTSMTSFLRWSMQTKWYGKSRNGVSFDRLACNRQKEALFLMPYYWDMKGWRATVSCRLDCAIKNGTVSCGYKSQPLSARQTKKSPWQYSLEVFQGIQPRIFLAVP